MLSVKFVGNLEACRVEAEISDESGTIIAVFYEDATGCHLDRFSTGSEVVGVLFDEFKERIRAELAAYVNRTGANAPVGLSSGGLALWLMLKEHRTAMGVPMPLK